MSVKNLKRGFTLSEHDLERELWLRKRERGELVWTTKDGKNIPLKDMTTEHSENCLTCMSKAREYEDAAWDFYLENEEAGDRL